MLDPIPKPVENVLRILSESGHEAYLVGGCVRDSLLGAEPKDWDVTTSARPEEVRRAFSRFRVLETGLRHGTVTVLTDGIPVEVTTFRVDGPYSDGRRPDHVSFAVRVEDDLARRDFTVNALAYSRERGLVDCFGGVNDLRRSLLKTVGNPDDRFQEDGLRILRALRFSSVLGFSVEEGTSRAVLKNTGLLEHVALERVREEFLKLLCGKNAETVLRTYRETIACFLPEIRPSVGFGQRNHHHIYDVWEHTLHAVAAIEPDPVLRLTMLLHDLGKPFCFTLDQNGVGHFYGHARKSAEMAREILTRLRVDGKTARTVTVLVRNHDITILPQEKSIRRALNRMGEDCFHSLLKVVRADSTAKAPDCAAEALAELGQIEEVFSRVLAQEQCFSLRNLAVNGRDLLALGVPEGAEIGRILDLLLKQVVDGGCPNRKAALLDRAWEMRKEEEKE